MSRATASLAAPVCAPLGAVDLVPPAPGTGQANRAAFRSLEYMQKEAVVVGGGDPAWRLASDEGPYLDATDLAPNPLAILGTGMVGAFFASIEAAADRRDETLPALEVVLDTRYTQQGSALAETMMATALPPHLTVSAEPGSQADIEALVTAGVSRSPVTAWLTTPLPSRFRLRHNGAPLDPDRVTGLDADEPPDPADLFASLPPVGEAAGPPLITHTGRETEPWSGPEEGYTGPGYSTMRDEHDRTLHLRFSASRRPDGTVHVEQGMYSPLGSVFELVTDPAGAAAPSPLAYVAAGIGFCFMTQLGRQSALRDVELTAARMVQDTHFPGPEGAGSAGPVATHLTLETQGDDDFARTVLAMAEQSCYAHAACRQGDLEPTVDLRLS